MLETAVLDPPSATRPRDPFRLVSSVEANARVVLGAYTLLYAFGFWVSASHTAFRFDEIFTFEIAQLPRIGDIWHVLRQGIELNPPLVFWITWILHKLFGGGPVISRLPAAFGFWGMTICLYHFVRRRTRPVYGLFAAVFPLLTFAADYRLLARAYGLELGFAALALLCWQLAVDGVCRRVTLFGLTFGIAAAISSHYYATYIVGALLIGELVRTYITKRVDYACIAAIAFGAVPLLAFRPLFGAVALGTKHFWMSSPKAEILLKCYGTILAPALLIALPLLVYLAVSRPVDRSAIHPNHGLYLWEGVAAGTLAAMPFAVFVAAFFIHLGFLDRYVILAVPGVSILLLCALYQLSGGSAASAGFLLRTAVWTCLLPWWIW